MDYQLHFGRTGSGDLVSLCNNISLLNYTQYFINNIKYPPKLNGNKFPVNHPLVKLNGGLKSLKKLRNVKQ